MYICLIHVDVWQKPTQYYKAIPLQLKINKLKTKSVSVVEGDVSYGKQIFSC